MGVSKALDLKSKAEQMVLEKQRSLLQTINENEKHKLSEIQREVAEKLGLQKVCAKYQEVQARAVQENGVRVQEINRWKHEEQAKTEQEFQRRLGVAEEKHTKDSEKVAAANQEMEAVRAAVTQEVAERSADMTRAAQSLRDRTNSQTRDVVESIWLEDMSNELKEKVKALPTPDQLKADGGLLSQNPTARRLDAPKK